MRTLLLALIIAGALTLGPLPAPAQESSPAEPSIDAPLLPLDQASEVAPPDSAMESATPMPDSAAVPADGGLSIPDTIQEGSAAPESVTDPAAAPMPESAPLVPEVVQEAAPVGQPSGDSFAAGLSAYNKQDFAAAVQNFESVVQASPQSADAYFYLGYSLYKLKRFDESRQAFAQLYHLQSNYRPPLPAAK